MPTEPASLSTMSQIAARFTRVRTTATTTPFEATGDEKKSAGLFVMTEYDGSLTYGVPFIAVRKYSRKATLVPSSVGTDAATMVPFGSTTATDSYSGERAAAAASAVRAAPRDSWSPRFVAYRTMSGSLATRMMSPRRLARYASIAFAVEVERWRMFVTPSAVRSLRVLCVETTLTSAIGATPTMRRAASTFCQNRTRGRRIRSPAPRALFVHLRARVRAWSAPLATGPSHRAGRARTGKVLVPT